MLVNKNFRKAVPVPAKTTSSASGGIPARWTCSLCQRQYCGAKPCPFCHRILTGQTQQDASQ
ncbi:hypothetical protein DNK65_19590 [Citrobacter koseri]|uniref:putative zinc ribbon protein n=1 Tax=Citrobacter koseri TaxID=545 RepID=UPI000D7BFDB8|nr:hypothetical protein DNK65_19590 [Citrobacter koseri]